MGKVGNAIKGSIATTENVSGLGAVTGIDIQGTGANKRYACRTDTGTAYLRKPTDTIWHHYVQFGINTPISNFVHKAPEHFYEIKIAPSNTAVSWGIGYGRVWNSLDDGQHVNVVTGFQGGIVDNNLQWAPSQDGAKSAGSHLAIHPTNENEVAIGHPINGVSYTQNGGQSFTLHPTLPAPINAAGERRGVQIWYDVENPSRVTVFIPGVGFHKSTTGIAGNFTLLANGPTYCGDMLLRGNRILSVGSISPGGDGQAWLHNGTSWSQPAGVVGVSVTSKVNDPNYLVVHQTGGRQWVSPNGGVDWTMYNDLIFKRTAADVPLLAEVAQDNMSMCMVRWDSELATRVWVSNGIGVWGFDNFPRTALNQLWFSMTAGIQQLLFMKLRYQPKCGRLIGTTQDRGILVWERGEETKEPLFHGPNYNVVLQHGTGFDWAADDEDYIVATFMDGVAGDCDRINVSKKGGKKGTWTTLPKPLVNGRPMMGGQVAVGNKGNIVWYGLDKNGGNYLPGKVFCTLNADALVNPGDWVESTFRNTVGGAAVDMTGAKFEWAYIIRHHYLISIKERPGEFLLYCPGVDGSGSAADLRTRGWWRATDGGLNFIRISDECVRTLGEDQYAGKAHDVSGYPDCIFWTSGNLGAGVTADGLYFSASQMAKGTKITMPNWAEVEDIAFGKNPTSNVFPRIYVKGFYNGVIGTWLSDDFNPASPTAATFTKKLGLIGGRQDYDNLLAADPKRYGRLVQYPRGGGLFVDTYSAPVKVF